jgi:outer membrane autotransporter protein
VAVADVTSATADGINATNGVSGGALSVTATGAITGATAGMRIDHRGRGAATIRTSNVTSSNGIGIDFRSNGYGLGSNSTDLTITSTGTIQGRDGGVRVETEASGETVIDVADVTSSNGDAVRASATGTDLSINASGQLNGQVNGVTALHSGSGETRIEVADVQATAGAGVFAQTSGSGLFITTTGTVTGGSQGINVTNTGSGDTLIAVSGVVSSAGIAIQNNSANQSVIELLSGADVRSTGGGTTILDGDNDTSVILRDGATLAGDIELSLGNDSLTIEGGADISAATRFNGGTGGDDALTLSNFAGTLGGVQLSDFETLSVQDGSDLTLDSSSFSGTNLIRIGSSSTITSQSALFITNSGLEVASGGSFVAGASGLGRAQFTRDVLNNGLISLADGSSGDTLTVGGNLSGLGTIGLDVNLTDGTHDQVQVNGDTAGATQGLDVEATGSTVDTAQNFTLVTVGGNSTESDFQLVNADFVTMDGAQAISDGEISYRLIYDAPTGAFVLTPFGPGTGDVSQNPGGAFLAAGVDQVSGQLTFAGTLRRVMSATQSGVSDANTVSRALSELTSTTRPLVWVQGEGRRDSYTIDDRDVETDSAGLRFGAGMPLAELSNGTLIGGIEFGVSNLSTDVTTSLTGADISTDAYDMTLSALWVADSLLYVDGQLRYGDFNSTIRPNGGQSVRTDSDGYGVSIEVGKPFGLSNGLTLVPQAQLMYSDIDTNDVVDLAGGGQVGSLVDGDTLTARLGLRAEHTLSGNAVLFGQVDYYHAFDSETAVAFGQNTVLTERGKNTAGLTLGGNVALSARTTLFGELTGETGFGSNASDYAIGGNVGLEFRF